MLRGVHLFNAFSNLTTPVRNLFEALRRGDLMKLRGHAPRVPNPERQRRQRRFLPSDVDQLVQDYLCGVGSVYGLAKKYGVHRNTIAKHLRDRGVELGRAPLTQSESNAPTDYAPMGCPSTQSGERSEGIRKP